MNTILSLLLIQVIVVFIVDISGAIESLKSGLKWLLTKGKMSSSNYILKPFDCSLCCTWWTCLIYLLCVGKFTIPYIAFVAFQCTFCAQIKDTILVVGDLCTKFIRLIYKHLID